MRLTGTPEKIMETIERGFPGAGDAVRKAHQITDGNSTKQCVYDYQAAALFGICQTYDKPGRLMLEIGTYYGFTAAVMAMAAPKAMIITLNPTRWEYIIDKEALTQFENVNCSCTSSKDFREFTHGQRFDFIFVDGDHKRIREDLPWWNKVKTGGTMMFHDYSPLGSRRHCPAVYQALLEFEDMLGREADFQVIDDGKVGMVGWRKRMGDEDYGIE